MTTSRSRTTPMPVTIPPEGTSPPYISQAARALSSRNGVPGSRSCSMRSRTNSFPLVRCFSRAASPPPVRTRARRSRSSATCASIRARFSRKEGSAVCIRVGTISMDEGLRCAALRSPVPYPVDRRRDACFAFQGADEQRGGEHETDADDDPANVLLPDLSSDPRSGVATDDGTDGHDEREHPEHLVAGHEEHGRDNEDEQREEEQHAVHLV